MRLLALLLLTGCSAAHAAAGRSCQAHLARVETLRAQRLAAVTELESVLTDLNAGLAVLESQTGFRENLGFVGRWLGGDAAMMASIRAKKASIESSLATLEEARAALVAAEAAVVAEARTWLARNDRVFADYVRHQDRLCPMLEAGKDCLTTITTAIETVESARTWDMIGGASSNKGVDWFAYAKTQEANDAIDEVKTAIASYRQALDAYHENEVEHGVTDANHVRGVDAFQQLMFDWITDTGFMDFMNYFRLGRSLEDLETLQKIIAAVHDEMVGAKKAVDAEIASRIRDARQRR